MPRPHTRRTVQAIIFFAIALVVSTFCRAADAPVYQDHENGYVVTLPDGWVVAPDAYTRDLEHLAKQMGMSANCRYVASFTPAKPTSVTPYVLTQLTNMPMRGVSYADLERVLGAKTMKQRVEGDIKRKMGDVIADARVGEFTLDRDHHRIVGQFSLSGPSGELRGVMIGFLTRDGIVQLNCYSPAKDFEKHLPLFEAMAETFALDPGREFVPGSGRSSILTSTLRGAVIGGLGGAVLYVIRRVKSKAA